LNVRTVDIHQVQIDKIRGIAFQQGLFVGRQFAIVRGPIGGKHYGLAVRRDGRFGVIAVSFGQAMVIPGSVPDKQIEFGVIVPGIPPFLARCSQLQFLPLLFAGGRIQMGRGKEDLRRVRMNPTTGGFPVARRNPINVARFQIHQVDLVERIIAGAFTLKDQLATIMAKIPLAGPSTFQGHLAGARDQSRFLRRIGVHRWGLPGHERGHRGRLTQTSGRQGNRPAQKSEIETTEKNVWTRHGTRSERFVNGLGWKFIGRRLGYPQDSNPQDSNPQDSNPQEGNPQEGNPQEGNPQEGNPQEGNPQEGNRSANPSGGRSCSTGDRRIDL
jgi:hypothetical protein